MEGPTHLWKAEPGGDRVQYAEAAVWRWVEIEAVQRTETGAADQGDPAQHRTVELLGVRREVNFSTEPECNNEFIRIF